MEYQLQARDTSLDAELWLFTRLRQMSIVWKARSTSGVSMGCRGLSLRGIKNQYPQATKEQLRSLYAQRLLGSEWEKIIRCGQVSQEVMIGDPIALCLLIADIFNQLKIPYFIGGSVASSLWGEPRATLDVDLVIDIKSEQVASFIAQVQGQFYVSEEAVKNAIISHSSFNLIHLETIEKIDCFIFSPEPLLQQEMQRRVLQKVTDEGDMLYVATAEDMIIQKLLWYKLGDKISERQWRDVLGILKIQKDYLDVNYLKHWAEVLKITPLLNISFQQADIQY